MTEAARQYHRYTGGGYSAYNTQSTRSSARQRTRSATSTRRAPSYYGSAAPDLRPQRHERPQQVPKLRPVPTKRTAPTPQGLSPMQVNVFKAIIAVVAVLICVCTLRVWFSSSTVELLQDVESLEAGIEQAYASSDEAEIEHSVLSSTQRIQEQAQTLGLETASEKVYITVPLAAQPGVNDDGKPCVYQTIQNIKKAKKLSKVIGS